MSKVQRVDFFAYIDDEVAELDCHESEDGAWVPASDYDAIAADNHRLRDERRIYRELLARIRGARELRIVTYWFDEIDAILAASK